MSASLRLLGVSLVLSAGCNTPFTVCEEALAAVNDMYGRCDVPLILELKKSDGTPASCDDASELEEGGDLRCECIPWTKRVDCEELRADPEELHPACDFSQIKYVE